MGEGVEEPGQKGGTCVTQQAATQHARGDFLTGDFAQRQKHPGGLDKNDHHHQAHRQDRRQMELRHAEMQGCDHLEPRRVTYAVEVNHAHRTRQHIAQRHTDQH